MAEHDPSPALADTPDLLPANATPLESAIARTMGRISHIGGDLRDLWDPDRCPVDWLPVLAWAHSVDTWQPYWSDADKRAIVRDSFAHHQRKGTRAAVEAAVAGFPGADLTIREWWEMTPEGDPHTFEVALTIGGGARAQPTAVLQTDIIAAIHSAKAHHTRMDFRAGAAAEGAIGVSAAMALMTVKTIEAQEAPMRGAIGVGATMALMTIQTIEAQEAPHA